MRTSMKSVIGWVVIGVLSILAVFGIMLSPAHAASGSPTPAPAFPTSAPTALPASPSDQYCLLCHSRANLTTQLPSGDSLYLTIDPTAFNSSIHGKASPAIHCVSCHTTITSYPHPPLAAQNLREVAISFSQSCQSCHPAEFAKQQDSIHQQALARGNENAAVCSDCHNPHYTSLPADPRAKIVTTCGTCHSGVRSNIQKVFMALPSSTITTPTCRHALTVMVYTIFLIRLLHSSCLIRRSCAPSVTLISK